MPRQKSLVTAIREIVQEQVQEAVQGLLGAVGGPKRKAKNGRRRRRKRRGPGRTPRAKKRMRRGEREPRIAVVFSFSAQATPSGAGGASRPASISPGRASPSSSIVGLRRCAR